jgi:hypothetical protein
MERDAVKASTMKRRDMLKRAAVAGGVAWAAPVLTSVRTPAFAQYGEPCEEDCVYVAHFEPRDFACSACQGICTSTSCGDCGGPACARITSVTCATSPESTLDVLRVCTDCQLDTTRDEIVFWEVPEGCHQGVWTIDPDDSSCSRTEFPVGHDVCAGPAKVELHFRCLAC